MGSCNSRKQSKTLPNCTVKQTVQLHDTERNHIAASPNLNQTLAEKHEIKIDMAAAVQLNAAPFDEIYKIEGNFMALSLQSHRICKCIHLKSNSRRLVKVIYASNNITTEEKLMMMKEIQFQRQFDYPSILKMLEYFEEDTILYIIYEYFEGTRLIDKMVSAKLNEEKVLLIMRQILETLAFLHSKDIVLRSILPESILCSDSLTLSFIDFRQAIYSKGNIQGSVGTLQYRAPEMINGKYGKEVDMWQSGVLMFLLCSGSLPFVGQNVTSTEKAIQRGVYSLETAEWNYMSRSTKNLVKSLLEYKPSHRITAHNALSSHCFKTRKQAKEKSIKVALQNLTQFQQTHAVCDAISMYFMNLNIKADDKYRLQQIFNELDTNHDGRLSAEELKIGFTKYLKKDPIIHHLDPNIDSMMHTIDLNNSGYLDFSEFVLACQNRQEIIKQMSNKKQLEDMFRILDRDGSGKISLSELRQILGGNKLNESLWQSIVKESNLTQYINKAGITENNFKSIMKKALDSKVMT